MNDSYINMLNNERKRFVKYLNYYALDEAHALNRFGVKPSVECLTALVNMRNIFEYCYNHDVSIHMTENIYKILISFLDVQAFILYNNACITFFGSPVYIEYYGYNANKLYLSNGVDCYDIL